MPRKKRELRNTLPNNHSFWQLTLSREDEVKQFLERGNRSQHEQMNHSLVYMERFEPEKFEEIKGKEILKKLKGKLQC